MKFFKNGNFVRRSLLGMNEDRRIAGAGHSRILWIDFLSAQQRLDSHVSVLSFAPLTYRCSTNDKRQEKSRGDAGQRQHDDSHDDRPEPGGHPWQDFFAGGVHVAAALGANATALDPMAPCFFEWR